MFEYVERTILEDLEKSPDGLPLEEIRKCIFQLVKSIQVRCQRRLSSRVSPRDRVCYPVTVCVICDTVCHPVTVRHPVAVCARCDLVSACMCV